MKTKQYAYELIEKFWNEIEEYPAEGYEPQDIEWQTAKKCAEIAVDLILGCGAWIGKELAAREDNEFTEQDTEEFWIEVREEINNL